MTILEAHYDPALAQEIRDLAKSHNAVILAHNYERPEIQDVADYVGDSLGLSRKPPRPKPMSSCSAACISWRKPRPSSRRRRRCCCPISPPAVPSPAPSTGSSSRRGKPNIRARWWSLVNTTAEVKAESDYCCTSGNAVDVINAIPRDREILFLPDMFLGAHVRRETGATTSTCGWASVTCTRASIRNTSRTRGRNIRRGVLIHPECGCATPVVEAISAGAVSSENVHILSTEG